MAYNNVEFPNNGEWERMKCLADKEAFTRKSANKDGHYPSCWKVVHEGQEKTLWTNDPLLEEQVANLFKKDTCIEVKRTGKKWEARAAEGNLPIPEIQKAQEAFGGGEEKEEKVPPHVWENKDKLMAKECVIKALIPTYPDLEVDELIKKASEIYDWVWSYDRSEGGNSSDFPKASGDLKSLLNKLAQDGNHTGPVRFQFYERVLNELSQEYDGEEYTLEGYNSEAMQESIDGLRATEDGEKFIQFVEEELRKGRTF